MLDRVICADQALEFRFTAAESFSPIAGFVHLKSSLLYSALNIEG